MRWWVVLVLAACSPAVMDDAEHTAGDDTRLDSGVDTGGEPDPVEDAAEYREAGPREIGWEDTVWSYGDRELPIRVTGPINGGPFPLVVLSHGFGEDETAHQFLADHWASHGYLVVAPRYVGTDRDALRGEVPRENFEVRLADVRFVLNTSLGGESGVELLDGRVDPERVAVVGHSMGSSTALSMVGLESRLSEGGMFFDPDPRVDLGIALSPQLHGSADPSQPPAWLPVGTDVGLHDASWSRLTTPILVTWGSADIGSSALLRNDPHARRVVHDRASVDVALAIIRDGEHHAYTETEPWYPAGPRDPDHWGHIRLFTTAYLEAQLFDRDVAAEVFVPGALDALTEGDVTIDPSILVTDGKYVGSEPGPWAVGSQALSFVDTERDLVQESVVHFPRDSGASRPLILLSHFAGGDDADYIPLARHWASHGYVVLLPQHREERGEDARQNWPERAQDCSFVLDKLEVVEAEIGLQIDRERIGAAGHYLGAHTAGVLGGMRVFSGNGVEPSAGLRDARVGPILMMSPTGRGQGLTEDSWAAIDGPMAVITGSEDPSGRQEQPPEWRTEPFEFATADGEKWLLWFEGLNSTYAGVVSADLGAEETDLGALLRASTLLYWQATLGDVEDGSRMLEARLSGSSAGRVAVTRK